MKNKYNNKLLLCLFILVLSLFLIRSEQKITLAPGDTYEISTSAELAYYSNLSKTSGYENSTFILTADITISAEDQEWLDENNQYINFGSSDLPFSGTFDGNGHTINNLKYLSTLSPKYDTGLFSYTSGATIRNLTINNAEIYSDYRGGILVGSATNTRIENVTITNSHLFVSAIDNVITLITDGGIRGGAIVGESTGGVLYNCEVNNTLVNTNSTSGVAALAGKGLTLGALVGKTNNTTVEYSRAVNGTKVSNYYDVAVGAVGGNVLYVGGIVGQMNGTSKVIDSFSTAELYYYCGTYVSVGAGNIGHIGGITAAMNGSTNEIQRSHYAGVATSRQYNAALVIPIVQNNVNISGIADVYDGGSVVSTYFKSSLNPDVEMKVLGNNSTTSSYGPLDDAKYIDKEYWQDQSYDFSGTIRRNTDYNNNHKNKWVIDMANGMPVHGKSISATFNFPNSGSVSIAGSSLVNSSVTTNNPYRFAVQGYKPNETTASVSVSLNPNYHFDGWYKVTDVYATSLDNDNDFFENIFDNNSVVSNSTSYSNITFADNDLYVAKVSAKVAFHDVDGHVINESGNQELHYENYYDYLDELPDVVPNTVTSSTFIGWTTIPASGNLGYDGITTTDLNNIKNQNEFYVAGDKIEKPLDLYPIYVNLLSNLNVIFEGNEQDSINDVTMRDGVGQATITKNANDTITLGITGAVGGNLPDGYRFLGWYEDGHRISKDATYTFSFDDIDLTTTHTFTARFEYRVRYYIRAYNQDNTFTAQELFDTIWMRYNEAFISIGTPGFKEEDITHWGTSSVNHNRTDDSSDAFSGNIVAPKDVYSHNSTSAVVQGYQVAAYTDFPGSGNITDTLKNTGTKFEFSPVSSRYHFMFWTLERNGASWTYSANPFDSGTLNTVDDYKAQAVVTTDVIFHKKDNSTETVTRRYGSNVLHANDYVHTYYYPYYNTSTVVATTTENSTTISSTVTLQASPSDASMDVNDYYFVGWISSTDVEYGSSEWNYIYDVAGDNYASSSIKKALPYIIDNNMLVEETMDLYPVYVKYDIETTTSLEDISTVEVNKPSDPTYTIVKNSDGTAVITIVPDESTAIKNGQPDLYELDYLSVFIDDGEEIIINKDGNGDYKYNIIAGPHYKFVANYVPYVIVYHLNTSSTETKVINKNSPVGEQPNPTFTVNNNYLFVGWTKNEPTGNYHAFESYTAYENANLTMIIPSTLVTDSYDLYPVYVRNNITVNSNIDSYLDANSISKSSVYSIVRNDIDTMTIHIGRATVNSYYFIGWYENYVDNNNLGTLVSSVINYKLSNSDNYVNKTYTAVYKLVYDVRYHKPDGTVFSTIHVREDNSRTFVHTILDSNNEPVEVPYDSSVYTRIYDYLNKNEYIKQFNYIMPNGTIVEWEDFKDTTITGDMDLYPVIYRVTAKDSSNNNIDLTVTNSRLNIALSQDNFLVKFNGDYTEPRLTVHLDEIQYTSSSPITTALSGKTVNLYKNDSDATVLFTKNTDSSGNAVFDLKVNFVLSKVNSATKNSDDTFIFTITNTVTHVSRKVTVASNSSTTVELYYGTYTIVEDTNWAWRYNNQSNNITINNNSTYTLSVTNTTNDNNWLDNTEYKNNSYEVTP